MISPRLVCVAAMMLGLGLAGCGSGKSSTSSSSQVAFKTGFATSQKQFRKLGTDLAKDITGAGARTDAELAKEFNRLATRAGQQADQLAALHVPAKYAQRVSSLVSGFHGMKADLAKISTAATDHDASSAEAATRTLLTDAAKIKTADVSLSKALGLPQAAGASSSSASTSASTTSTTTG